MCYVLMLYGGGKNPWHPSMMISSSTMDACMDDIIIQDPTHHVCLSFVVCEFYTLITIVKPHLVRPHHALERDPRDQSRAGIGQA